ncbi:hypothetical protein SAV31267_007310 [Streptomyces avermitilis]|uniref:Uncharacterized protein n=1 Tax=Streptomyces avermitilis TaxID=33903 RepID=A0A4D4MHF6_STRAX|nr:hypothetical protein SAV31267_007310 [Streptomyces avermitilis]
MPGLGREGLLVLPLPGTVRPYGDIEFEIEYVDVVRVPPAVLQIDVPAAETTAAVL